VQDRIVRVPRDAVADLNGDGRPELAYNLIDLTKDAVWHVIIHDAVSGKVAVDLAGRYLDSLADLDGDRRPELLLSESEGLQLPARRVLHVASLDPAGLRERWHGRGRLHQRFDDRVPPHVCEQLPFYDAVTGDLDGDGRQEILVSRWEGDVERCVSVGLGHDGQPVERPILAWPASVAGDVMAVADIDHDGRAEALLRCRVSEGEPVLRSTDAGLSVLSWSRRPDQQLLGPPIVARLDGTRPTIVVPTGWRRVTALQVRRAGEAPQRLWSLRGRGMSRIYERGHGGVAAADLDGDGRQEVVFSAEGPTSGGACILAADATGRVLWRHEFRHIQWAPTRGWGPGALRTWSIGRFRKGRGPDVYASAHLNCMHSGTSHLLDGRTGSLAWERLCLEGRVKEMGGGHVSIADLDGNGLDDIVGGYCNFLFALDGRDGSIRTAAHQASLFHPVMKGSWVNSTTPLVVDADGDATGEILLGRHRLVVALLDGRAKSIRWWHAHRSGVYSMPGLADVDGDGRQEVGVAGAAGTGGRLICLGLASGKPEWEMPLPSREATDFASGDVDGDGLAEYVFACDRTLYAVSGRGGKPHTMWSLRLPARCGPPILADADGDGRSEILLVTDDGYLHCIDAAR